MLHGIRVFDADAHVLEPDDPRDRRLDRGEIAFAPRTRRISREQPY